MQTITKYLILVIVSLSVTLATAQEDQGSSLNKDKIEQLEKLKKTIKEEERALLKARVEAINQRLDDGDISENEAKILKKEAAKKHALNIEDRVAIIDNKISLLNRNPDRSISKDDDDSTFRIVFDRDGKDDQSFYFGKRKNRVRRYDRRTSSDLVLAFGFNNAIIEGSNLDDSPYKLGGSRFFEIGWAWKTRVFKNTNWLRLKYGYSFQINGFKLKDNMYFVQDGNETKLETFEYDLNKSKLSISNLVFPVHFEIGPSRRIDREDYFRYSTHKKFKLGLGGYAGFNIGTRQKLKYSAEGEKIKDKMKRDYNSTDFVYGLSGYVAIGDIALYVKYELSPMFKDQTIEQNNISVGVRFDMD